MPAQSSRRRKPLIERLMTHVQQSESGCWTWLGYKNNKGYGMLLGAGKSLVLAHRASYEVHVSDIPQGLQVLHACDNPACVNPRHLFLGTTKDNIADMVAKGRNARGEMQPHAKLSAGDIALIRNSQQKQKEIASIYKISQGAVSMIQNGKRWSHIK